jgi:hypothetical protein
MGGALTTHRLKCLHSLAVCLEAFLAGCACSSRRGSRYLVLFLVD